MRGSSWRARESRRCRLTPLAGLDAVTYARIMSEPVSQVIEERARLYRKAAERARIDREFRRQLLGAPREALDELARALGLDARVPAELAIEVIDGTYDTLHLVLPPFESTLLAEDQLERVSGGTALSGSATLRGDAHGCPACPHPGVGLLAGRTG
jgi:hypothetical protein